MKLILDTEFTEFLKFKRSKRLAGAFSLQNRGKSEESFGRYKYKPMNLSIVGIQSR